MFSPAIKSTRDFRRCDVYDFCAKNCPLARRLRHTWRAAVVTSRLSALNPLSIQIGGFCRVLMYFVDKISGPGIHDSVFTAKYIMPSGFDSMSANILEAIKSTAPP